MRRRLALAPTLLFVALAGGCARTVAPVAPPPPKPPAQATISALTEVEGTLLAELPLGTRDGIAIGEFLRAYGDKADRRPLKGTLQVTELVGDDRCLARLIALNDRTNPLRIGDRAKVIADLAAEDPPAPVAAPATDDKPAGDKAADDDTRFAAVREHYQRELAAVQRRHDQELAELQVRLEHQSAEAAEARQRALDDSELSHRAVVAQLKADLETRQRDQLVAENAARDQRIGQIASERDALKAQVETLLREQQRLTDDVAKAKAAAVAADDRRKRELRAEVETREVLQGRLTEVEHRLDGKPSRAVAVLTNDADRHETVIERLDRVQTELTAANAKLAATEAELADTRARRDALEASVTRLSSQVEDLERAHADLTAAQTHINALAGERAAHEVARLEAERALYDLAARVLRLDPGQAETASLQSRVRAALAASDGEAAKPAAEPGSDP